MPEHRCISFGLWPSPIGPRDVASGGRRFGHIVKAADGWTYWSETRPEAGGGAALMRARVLPTAGQASGGQASGRQVELEELTTPPAFSVRSRVHEYGGAEFSVSGRDIYFVNDSDQDIYRLVPGATPQRVTQEPRDRYADIAADPTRGRLVAVAERSTSADRNDHALPENLLVTIATEGPETGRVEPLLRSHDFYAFPILSPDANQIAFLAWDLPAMPWEECTLFLAEIDADGAIGKPEAIAGGRKEGSAGQPIFEPDGSLLFLWDTTGWDNIYRYDGTKIEPLRAADAEYGRPLWGLGTRSYARLGNGCIWAAPYVDGETRTEIISVSGGIETPPLESLRAVTCAGELLDPTSDSVPVLATFDDALPAIAEVASAGRLTILRRSGDLAISPQDLSVGQPITFPGFRQDRVHALYYPPTLDGVSGPAGEKPPAIVLAHGGPTGMADRGVKLKIQYWTTRGFAVIDVDYSGSAGFGRAYRERLDGAWGLRDVADVAAAARHLKAAGLADKNRVGISGGSAGGYTVLMALAMSDEFAAGAASYPVTDLGQLLEITHKFESGYLYRLTGTTPDDHETIFRQRSPLEHVKNIRCPVIFFQGSEDKVVPPDQARAMSAAMRANGVRADYHEFAGEQHGWRRLETIEQAMALEYDFYLNVFKLAAT